MLRGTFEPEIFFNGTVSEVIKMKAVNKYLW